jgi:hypothetical protein
MCVPPHHDLPEWSCVNIEINVFNRELVKLMKLYKHVSIVTVDTDRKFYTRHGLHMKNLGKEKIASEVSTIFKNIFQKRNVKISLFWKNGYDISVKSVSDNLTEGICVKNVSDNPITDQITIEDMEVPTATPSSDEGPRISKRKKKPPTTKSEDFLW